MTEQINPKVQEFVEKILELLADKQAHNLKWLRHRLENNSEDRWNIDFALDRLEEEGKIKKFRKKTAHLIALNVPDNTRVEKP